MPAMAVGVLRTGEQVVFDDTDCLFMGELGLDGALLSHQRHPAHAGPGPRARHPHPVPYYLGQKPR